MTFKVFYFLLLLLLLSAPPPAHPLSVLQSPPHPQPTQSVTFAPLPPPAAVTLCSWYRAANTDVSNEIGTLFGTGTGTGNGTGSGMTTGPAYSGREEIEPGCSMTIRDLRVGDGGVYTVLIRDPQISRASIELTVYERLSMPEVTPEEAMVVEGDNVSLQCHPPNGSVTVGWHRGDAALSPGGRLWLSADNRTLTVTAAQRGDAGPYGCHVANPISTNRSRDVNLTVAYGPDSASISPPGPIWLPLGAELTLHCSAPSVPPSDVTWGRGNVTLGAGPELRLVLSDSAHFGTIRCQATNPALSLSADAHVELRLGAGPGAGLSEGGRGYAGGGGA